MYENLTGEQFKELPEEQKKEALVELTKHHPTIKELAEHLGVKGNVAGIWVAKYLLGHQMGRQPKEQDVKLEDNKQTLEKHKILDSIFSASLESEYLKGNEAKERIVGIGSSLLDDKTYAVALTVNELPT